MEVQLFSHLDAISRQTGTSHRKQGNLMANYGSFSRELKSAANVYKVVTLRGVPGAEGYGAAPADLQYGVRPM
jgi:hypothetical protein